MRPLLLAMVAVPMLVWSQPPAKGAATEEGDAEYRALARNCARGDAASCADQGARLSLGMGVKRDELRAIELSARACDLGNMWGCKNAGDPLVEGKDVPKDEARGYVLLEKACALDEGFSCLTAALGAHRRREVVKRDQMLNKACGLKVDAACKVIAMIKSKSPNP